MEGTSLSAGRSKDLFHAWILLLLSAGLVGLSGCAFGPRHIPADRFDYNEAIARSTQEQMLLNIVRLRYFEEPVFLTVSSVLTQYAYRGGVGVNGALGLGGPLLPGGPDSSVGGNANLGYEERPTITYLPVGGQEFAAQFFRNVPSDIFFGAAQGGYRVDVLMKIGIQRIGAVENMSFAGLPSVEDMDRPARLKQDFEKLKRFHRALELLGLLADAEVIEVQQVKKDETVERYLMFAEIVPEDLRPLVREVKQLVGLSPDLNRFRITERFTSIKDDEISFQTRGLMGIMEFLAKGIEVPPEQVAAGVVEDFGFPAIVRDSGHVSIPFRVRSSKKRPENPFAAVRYQGYWFYIENTDTESKQALAVIMTLYRLQAPTPAGAAPVLTLPAGG